MNCNAVNSEPQLKSKDAEQFTILSREESSIDAIMQGVLFAMQERPGGDTAQGRARPGLQRG